MTLGLIFVMIGAKTNFPRQLSWPRQIILSLYHLCSKGGNITGQLDLDVHAGRAFQFLGQPWAITSVSQTIRLESTTPSLGQFQSNHNGRETPTEPLNFRLERDLYSRKDQFGVEIRERAKWDIRESMVGTETFEPKHIVIATWKNVSFAGGIPVARRLVSFTMSLLIKPGNLF